MSVDAPPRRDERFPTDVEYRDLLDRRTRRARVFQVVSLLALTTGVVALATLIYTIVNDSFGWVAVVNAREPEEVVEPVSTRPRCRYGHSVQICGSAKTKAMESATQMATVLNRLALGRLPGRQCIEGRR